MRAVTSKIPTRYLWLNVCSMKRTDAFNLRLFIHCQTILIEFGTIPNTNCSRLTLAPMIACNEIQTCVIGIWIVRTAQAHAPRYSGSTARSICACCIGCHLSIWYRLVFLSYISSTHTHFLLMMFFARIEDTCVWSINRLKSKFA